MRVWLVVLLIVVASGPVGSATLTVTTGQGLRAAVSGLRSGDTLVLAQGIYQEALDDVIPSGVTLQAAPGAQVIIQTSGVNKIINVQGKSSITFDGLILDGSDPASTTYGVFLGGSSTNIVFRNGTIRNTEQCVLVGDGSNHNTFEGSRIQNCGRSGQFDHCIYDGESFNTYRNNEITGCQGFGMHFYNESHPGNLHDNTAVGNYVHGPMHLGGILVGGARMTIYNNVVADTGSAGINVEYTNPHNSIIDSNTIYNSCAGFAGLYVEGSGHQVRNNVVYCPAGGALLTNASSGSTLSHNLSGADPLFTNASAGDFHIASAGSPAVNAGMDLSAPENVDKDHFARPAGQFTIGAYQLGSSATTPPSAGLPAPKHFRMVLY